MIGYYPLRDNSGTAGWNEKRTKISEGEPRPVGKKSWLSLR